MYVLATTNGEVLKVPMFVEHFMEYHGSFSEFVMEHYDNHKEDSDWDTDQKLPFINPPIVLLTVHAQLPELSFEIKNLRKLLFQRKAVFTRKKRLFQPIPFSDFPATAAFLIDFTLKINALYSYIKQ